MNEIMNTDRYEGMTIEEVERNIRASAANASSNMHGVIAGLFYLEKTNLFRENPRHRNSTFVQYLKAEYVLSYSRYLALKQAFLGWPRLCLTYGPNTIINAKIKCGIRRVDRVAQEIEATEASRAKPLSQDEIDTVINRNAVKGRRRKAGDPPDYKSMYETTLEKLRLALAENKELIEQRDKLISTVNRLKGSSLPHPTDAGEAEAVPI